jgi:hypothetical protein
MITPPCCFYHDNVPSNIAYVKGERLNHGITEPMIAKCGDLQLVGMTIVCCAQCPQLAAIARRVQAVIYVTEILNLR